MYTPETGFANVGRATLVGILNCPDWEKVLDIRNMSVGEQVDYSRRSSGKPDNSSKCVQYVGRRSAG